MFVRLCTLFRWHISFKKNPFLLFRSFASAHCFNRTFISIINLVCLSRFELFGDVVSRVCCLCCHCWWVLGALFCYYFGGRLPCEMFCGLDSWGKSPLTSIHLSFVPFIPHLLVPLGTISLCRVDNKLPSLFCLFSPRPLLFFSVWFWIRCSFNLTQLFSTADVTDSQNQQITKRTKSIRSSHTVRSLLWWWFVFA